MFRRNALFIVLILILFGLALWTVLPLDANRFGREGMRLGLDLIGGVHLVYETDFPADATGEEKARDMQRARMIIERRIDKYGVTEPVIQTQGTERIIVKLPGFTDVEAAKNLVAQTGFLEFRTVERNSEGGAVYLSNYLDSSGNDFFDKSEQGNRIFVDSTGSPLVFLTKDEEGLKFTDESGNPIDTGALPAEARGSLSWIAARGTDGTQLTGDFLDNAAPVVSQEVTGAEYQVSIEWDSQGRDVFDQIADYLYHSAEYGSPLRALGIFLDDSLISSPQILQPAYRGQAVITGDFTPSEVEDLANLLKSGALPMPLKKQPFYQGKVAGTLGADFINRSITAGIIGIILVMLFMIAYYRLSGFLASLALIFYGVLVLAIFKLIPVTLTLAGLGGFILSIGMAVDANVLIFERMKEELRMGRTLGAAIESGFNRAWSAIRDSNVTTFIVCAILYWVGNSIVAGEPVMGFALTLFIGVAVSMFTAIVVTRTLLRILAHTGLSRKTALFSSYRRKK